MSRGARIAAIVVLGSLLFASCGGGGDNGGGGGGSTGAPAQTGSGGSTGSGGVTGAFNAAECTQVGLAMSAAAGAIPAVMSGSGGDVQNSVDQLQGFVDKAPDEIKGDLATVAAGYAGFTKAMADSGYDPSSGQPPSAEVIAAMQTAAAAVNTAEFKAASDRVSAWLRQNCGG
jgi:hypothetical protein